MMYVKQWMINVCYSFDILHSATAVACKIVEKYYSLK